MYGSVSIHRIIVKSYCMVTGNDNAAPTWLTGTQAVKIVL